MTISMGGRPDIPSIQTSSGQQAKLQVDLVAVYDKILEKIHTTPVDGKKPRVE